MLSLDNAVASDKKASTTRQLELRLSIGARNINEQLSEITAEQPAMPDIKAKSVSHMSVYRAKVPFTIADVLNCYDKPLLLEHLLAINQQPNMVCVFHCFLSFLKFRFLCWPWHGIQTCERLISPL